MPIKIEPLIFLNEWDDDLCCWCPAQSYRTFEHDGQVYDLYLRWRWSDPWQGKVIHRVGLQPDQAKSWKGGQYNHMPVKNERWSCDLLELHGKKWDKLELEEAKKSLVSLVATEFLRNPAWDR